MSSSNLFTNATGGPMGGNTTIMAAGPRGPALLQAIWPIGNIAHFDREVGRRYRNGFVNVGKVNRPAG